MSTAPTMRPFAATMRESAPATLRRVITVLEAVLRRTTRVQWDGQQHIPSGGVVIAANHVSHFDFASLGHFVVAAGRWPHFLAKESVFRVPVLGRLIAACDQIPVHRGSTRSVDALAAANRAVTEGKALLIYPEGTITKDPELWPMVGRTGAVRIALTTGRPLVPVAQWGPQLVIPPPRPGWPRLLPRKTMRVVAGEPMDLSAYRDRPLTAELLEEATAELMARITGLLAGLRGERPPG